MKAKLGDVIEISTSIGLAYAQYTNYEASYGELIRVFDKLYETRPIDFSYVVSGRVRFSVFFSISSALRQKIINKVSNQAIGDENKEFPLFRYGIPNPKSRKVEQWFFWKGGDEYVLIDNFTENHKHIPILGSWNYAMLVERIEENWHPEDYF